MNLPVRATPIGAGDERIRRLAAVLTEIMAETIRRRSDPPHASAGAEAFPRPETRAIKLAARKQS